VLNLLHGPAVTVLALILIVAELILTRLAPIAPIAAQGQHRVSAPP
jgi:hypothetical protein